MPPTVAFFGFFAFTLWLLARDTKRGAGRISPAVWIPVIWIVIAGSRPVSQWFGLGAQFETTADYVEGSPLDRSLFLLLIGFGLVVLWRRRLDWNAILTINRWLFLFYLYFCVSTVWSDYSFVSFKRWLKDFGNVVMALVILTDGKPMQAVKAMFARCIYLLIPSSVLLIKYVPDLGRSYNRWTWEAQYTGVSTEKNSLGITLAVCAVALSWLLLEVFNERSRKEFKAEIFANGILMLMVVWLLAVTHSSTALMCSVLGAGILCGLRLAPIQSRIRNLEWYGLAALILLLVLEVSIGVSGVLLQVLGRDSTLTGRSDIWRLVLAEPINPLIGVGFYSFWLGDRTEVFWQKYYFHLNQAHNGYIETYLNGGLFGVCFLALFLASVGSDIKRELVKGSDYGRLRFAFFVIAIIYNMTEAVFCRINVLWLVFLLVGMNVPRASLVRSGRSSRLRRSTSMVGYQNLGFGA